MVRRDGRVYQQGESLDWINGHNATARTAEHHPKYVGEKRVNAQGYVMVLASDHPKGQNDSRVREHVLMVEKVLGRHLPDGAIVHHVNGNKTDNRNDNFVLCESRAYHSIIEARTRAYRATGNANAKRCTVCKQWDTKENLRNYHPYQQWHHPTCWAKKLRDRYRRLKSAA